MFRSTWLLCLALGAVSVGCRPSSTTKVADEVDIAASALKGSKYPFVLMHGFMGWDRAFYTDYFYGIPDALKAQGYRVYETHVSPLNSVDFRAKQAAAQIDAILASSGAGKVNIIAHSMGGLDARHLISALGYGDKVASLSMISTPNLGSPVADIVIKLLDVNSDVHAFIDKIFNKTSDILESDPTLATYGPVDLSLALTNLSTDFAKRDFAPSHPDNSNVYYQSWGGHVTGHHKVSPDLLEPLVNAAYMYMYSMEGDNDGVVSVTSARYGIDRGVLPTDHLDEIGQMLGREPVGFDREHFYSTLVSDLVIKGY